MKGERTYEIHDVLGKGGFGTVYSATLRGESGFTKSVAVKILNEDVEDSSDHASRLRDEARLLGLVRHRAILHVDGLVSFGGRWAIVTEYVAGANLLRLIHKAPVPVGVALEIAAEVAGALHAAWTGRDPTGRELRLIHRDIKPSNIQITRAGEVKLLDFGIAQAEFLDRESRTTDLLLGSPAYMSPEQLDMRYGPEGDVYGLAVVICEAISGKRFGKTSANRELHDPHVDETLGKVARAVGPAFAEVEALLRSMLAYDAEKRPTANQVEAECLLLRRTIQGPWLREWADAQVAAVGERASEADDLVGHTLVEGKTRLAPERRKTRPPLITDATPTPRASAPRRVRRRWLVWGLSLGAFAIAFSATVWVAAALVRYDREGGADGPTVGAVTGAVAEIAEPAPSPPEPPPVVEPVPEPIPSAEPEPVAAVAPAPVAAPAPIVAPTPVAAPVPKPRPSGAGVVSVDQFSAWLAANPQWTRDRAIADGTADANYLRGWVGASPPEGRSGAATDVSWWAAKEFCASRGGLAAVDAAPREWSETSGVFQEWRVDGERAAWRRFDGATSTAVRHTESNGFTGFRCAR